MESLTMIVNLKGWRKRESLGTLDTTIVEEGK